MSSRFIDLALPGVRELEPYQPGKPIEELERELGLTDVIKLASNENPQGPSESVRESLLTVIPELSRYPDGSAYNLKRALSAHLGLAPDRITVGNGSNDVLELLARVFLSPGDEAVVSRHAFVVYPLVIKASGARQVIVPAREWGHDLEAMAAAISARTRMVFIANPNNPTGTWVRKSELVSFLERVRDDVLVVLDEAYSEYVEEPEYPNGVELLSRYPNLVVTRTFSKVYGLASLRVGYGLSHPDIADLMNRIRQPFNVNAMSLAAACAALEDQAYVKRSIALNREGLEQLARGLTQLELDYIPSVGNFITFDVARDAGPVYDSLLREGVIVRPIGVYEMPHHLRVTTGLPEENARFLDALARVLQRGPV